jgi:alpha-N-arabinofuranosidase
MKNTLIAFIFSFLLPLTIFGQDNKFTVQQDAKPVEYNRMIFGQFIEHFHRQIYGGIFEPGSMTL